MKNSGDETSSLGSAKESGQDIAEHSTVMDFSELPEESSVLSSDDITRGGIITARGTADGLVIRLDARVDRVALKQAVEEFLDARRSFLSGQQVALEWVGARPDDLFVSELSGLLQEKFSIGVRSSKVKEQMRLPLSVDKKAASARSKSLFDGMEVLNESRSQKMKSSASDNTSKSGFAKEGVAKEGSFWDDADARIVYTTLRSGQRIETDHSLIVFGDVNSGAEVVAGGDIIVLGTLRGVAHAGAYDETGGGRVVFSLNLQATQLRIGTVISRGSTETSQKEAPQKSAELARVEGGLIVVEPYSVKSLSNRRRE
jgi:septum site-determining protein MinC